MPGKSRKHGVHKHKKTMKSKGMKKPKRSIKHAKGGKKRYTRKMRHGGNGDEDEYENDNFVPRPESRYIKFLPETGESSTDDDDDDIVLTDEEVPQTPPPTYTASMKKTESNIEDCKDIMKKIFKQNLDKSRGYINSQKNSIDLSCTSTKYISKEECDSLKEKLQLYLQQLDTIEENVLTYNNYSYNIPNGEDRRLDPASDIKSVKDWIKAIDMVTSGAGEIIKNFQFHVMDKCTGTFKYTKLEQKKKGFFERNFGKKK